MGTGARGGRAEPLKQPWGTGKGQRRTRQSSLVHHTAESGTRCSHVGLTRLILPAAPEPRNMSNLSNVSSRPCFQLGPREMGVLTLTSSCCIHRDGRGGALGPAPTSWFSSAQQGGDSRTPMPSWMCSQHVLHLLGQRTDCSASISPF